MRCSDTFSPTGRVLELGDRAFQAFGKLGLRLFAPGRQVLGRERR